MQDCFRMHCNNYNFIVKNRSSEQKHIYYQDIALAKHPYVLLAHYYRPVSTVGRNQNKTYLPSNIEKHPTQLLSCR